MFKQVMARTRQPLPRRVASAREQRARLVPAPPRVRQVHDDARSLHAMLLPPQIMSSDDAQWLSWHAVARQGLNGADAVLAFAQRKQQVLQELRIALASVARSGANGQAPGSIHRVRHAAESIAFALGLRRGEVLLDDVPVGGRVHWSRDRLSLSVDALEQAQHAQGMAELMRDMVEGALVHFLFGPDKAMLGHGRLDCREQRLLQDWLNMLYLHTAPPDGGPALLQSAREAMKQECVKLHARLDGAGLIALDAPAPGDAGARTRVSLGSASVFLPCTRSQLQLAVRETGILLDGAIDAAAVRPAWSALGGALSTAGGRLFAHYNEGLPAPATPPELVLRLVNFSNWWRETGAG